MLDIDKLTIRFGGLTAVNQVSLNVNEEEILGLVGPNGAGKTTLFNAISGLVRPTSGQIRFQDRNILRKAQFHRARLGIGRTFQIPQPLFGLSVYENLRVAQRFSTGKSDHRKLGEVMELMGLADKADLQASSDLALTELKALEIAKALATEPRLLLLDEVLAGLEVKGKQQLMRLLKVVQQQRKLGILIIEHDIETIMQLCSRVCVLDFGRVIADGGPHEVFAMPEVIKSYTGDDGHA